MSVQRQATLEEIEAGFHKVLEDTFHTVTKLGPLCNSVEELLSLIELGIVNPAQRRLLMKEILEK